MLPVPAGSAMAAKAPKGTSRMADLTSTERILRGSIAGNTSWANTKDRTKRTQPGRDANRAKYEKLVDPDGKLDPAERAKRAGNAFKADMARLAFLSAKARRKKKAS
jgi:hypothetical protein